jgi:hypothetical protein
MMLHIFSKKKERKKNGDVAYECVCVISIVSLFVWPVLICSERKARLAGLLREKKYYWLEADKPNEHGECFQ